MKNIFAVAAVAAFLMPTSAEAIDKCRGSNSCAESLAKCQNHRTKNGLSRAELPCERSEAECRKTGIWRGKYMRGTPEVLACRIK